MKFNKLPGVSRPKLTNDLLKPFVQKATKNFGSLGKLASVSKPQKIKRPK